MNVSTGKARFAGIAVSLMLALCASLALAADWTKLGERKVSDRVDHDTIAVGAVRGRFTALKLTVGGNPVHFKKVVVHYRNGSKEQIELRDVIPAGGESRVIDLKGGNRVIKSIEFWYEANSLGRGGSEVRAFGRR